MFIRLNWKPLFNTDFFVPYLVVSVGCALGIFLKEYYERQIVKAETEWARAEWRADSLDMELREVSRQLNRTVHAVSNLRSKSGEWFIFMQIGESPYDHIFASNLDLNLGNLRYIYKVCADSGVPFWFVNETLFRESRMGTNVRHPRNRDGSIDAGDFGLNSRNHHPSSLGNPRKDVYKFISFFRRHVEKYDESKWNAVYRLGETRARKYGIIP